MAVPLITVLVSVTGFQRHLNTAIQSVLKQTIRGFELIICCQDDEAERAAQHFARKGASRDPRIILYRSGQVGRGSAITHTVLNRPTRYVALMDPCHEAHPKRFELQLAQLEKNGAGVCGCNVKAWRLWSMPRSDYPLNSDTLKLGLAFAQMMPSTTLMLKSDLIERFPWDDAYDGAQEYEWLGRLATAGIRLENVAEPLVSIGHLIRQRSSRWAEKSSKLRAQQMYVDRQFPKKDAFWLFKKFFGDDERPAMDDAEALIMHFDDIRWAAAEAKMKIFELALSCVKSASHTQLCNLATRYAQHLGLKRSYRWSFHPFRKQSGLRKLYMWSFHPFRGRAYLNQH